MSRDNLNKCLMTAGHIWSIEDVWEAKSGFFVARFTERDMPRHMHTHRYIQIQLVLEGKLVHTVNDRQEILDGGQLLAIPPLTYHRIATPVEGEAVQYYSIGFMPEFISGLLDKQEDAPAFLYYMIFGETGSPYSKITLDDRTLAFIRQKTEQMVIEFTLEESGYLPMLRALLTQFMIRIGRVYEKQVGLLSIRDSHVYGELMRACINYMKHHFGHALHLTEVAKHFALSRTSFCHYFKCYTGTTFYTYLNQIRIGYAKNLIAMGATNFVEVALSAGFTDYTTFARCFKRVTGKTPSHYREELRFCADAQFKVV